jgi:hypothetical protein
MEVTTASGQMDRDAEDVRSESAGLNETRRVTQVVDGNWGVHAVIKKSIFAGK